MAPRGRPRDTIAQRNNRRRQREARRREQQRIAQLLRDITARGINDGRRYSLRLASQYLNRDQPGRYSFVLFGEEGWKENDLYDHQIRANYFECMFEGQRCRYFYKQRGKQINFFATAKRVNGQQSRLNIGVAGQNEYHI